MRLQAPDDELGGMLLLTTPFLVVHRIDEWSPLYDIRSAEFKALEEPEGADHEERLRNHPILGPQWSKSPRE